MARTKFYNKKILMMKRKVLLFEIILLISQVGFVGHIAASDTNVGARTAGLVAYAGDFNPFSEYEEDYFNDSDGSSDDDGFGRNNMGGRFSRGFGGDEDGYEGSSTGVQDPTGYVDTPVGGGLVLLLGSAVLYGMTIAARNRRKGDEFVQEDNTLI